LRNNFFLIFEEFNKISFNFENLKIFSSLVKLNLFETYSKILNTNGILISSKAGMKWSRQIKPVLSFSFKKMFYKRLKEFESKINSSDALTEKD